MQKANQPTIVQHKGANIQEHQEKNKANYMVTSIQGSGCFHPS